MASFSQSVLVGELTFVSSVSGKHANVFTLPVIFLFTQNSMFSHFNSPQNRFNLSHYLPYWLQRVITYSNSSTVHKVTKLMPQPKSHIYHKQATDIAKKVENTKPTDSPSAYPYCSKKLSDNQLSFMQNNSQEGSIKNSLSASSTHS